TATMWTPRTSTRTATITWSMRLTPTKTTATGLTPGPSPNNPSPSSPSGPAPSIARPGNQTSVPKPSALTSTYISTYDAFGRAPGRNPIRLGETGTCLRPAPVERETRPEAEGGECCHTRGLWLSSLAISE
ncbi:MAG: hypothetical protein WBE46_06860, partial [Dehalococcoidia bacterium]